MDLVVTATGASSAALAARRQMSDSTPSVDAAESLAGLDSAPAALSAASHSPSVGDIAPASAAIVCEPSSSALAPASDVPLTAPSSASEPVPPAVDASAAAAPSSSATVAAALASPPVSSARRRANPAVVSGSAAVNRSALLSSGRSSTVVPRGRSSDVAKPTVAAAAKPKPAAATAAASSSSSSALRPSARPLFATPRKPIVLAQPPPSHSAARGNRRVPQPPEPPGYSGLLYAHVLGCIFSYLEFASLRSAVCVSPSWRSAVGSMRPITAGRFKFVYPLKKTLQLAESSPLNKHVSQVGANDATYHSQEINLTLLAPMVRCFSHLATMHIKLGSSAWMSKATPATFVFPPSVTALAFTFGYVRGSTLPPDSMINQVTHQLLASIAALPVLSRLYLNLHWTETLDLSALQSAHDRGSLRHLTLDLGHESLSAKQTSAVRSLTQLESLVLLVDSYDDPKHHRMLLAVPHAPFAWQRILRLRGLNAAECMELIPPLTELRELELYRIAEGLPALHSLAHLTRLSVITQYNATFKQAEAAALTVGLAGCVHLTALKIDEAHICSVQLAEIVAPLTNLRDLSLCFLPRLESYEWATTGPLTQSLRSLSFMSMSRQVPAGGFQQLRALRALRRLEFAERGGCGSGWSGVSAEEARAASVGAYWPDLKLFRFTAAE